MSDPPSTLTVLNLLLCKGLALRYVVINVKKCPMVEDTFGGFVFLGGQARA